MTLKTPNLFDVPKDRPTRKQRLEAFKEQHEIFTYGNKNAGWDAMLVSKARESLLGYDGVAVASPIELIMDYCRLLEESQLLISGETEREAIEELCRLNNIKFDL